MLIVNILKIFFPYFAYIVLVSASSPANRDMPKISPHTLGIRNAFSAYTETQLDMVFSAQAPKKMQAMQSRSPFVPDPEPADFTLFCSIFMSGRGDILSHTDAITGSMAQKKVRYIQY